MNRKRCYESRVTMSDAVGWNRVRCSAEHDGHGGLRPKLSSAGNERVSCFVRNRKFYKDRVPIGK